jgi:ankyrin repeat protein
MPFRRILALLLVASFATVQDGATMAQTPPSASDAARYTGLLAAAYEGDADEAHRLIAAGSDLEITDGWGRTPLHVAAFRSGDEVVSVLAEAGADMNALDSQAYDIVTIAAVANDPNIVRHALSLGASPANVTSLYDGTALIAAAHLGHHEVVTILIAAGAPVDHINNLDWTALIEAVVLGDGGESHQKTVKGCCQTNANQSQFPADGGIQAAPRPRHSERAAARLSLKLSRE